MTSADYIQPTTGIERNGLFVKTSHMKMEIYPSLVRYHVAPNNLAKLVLQQTSLNTSRPACLYTPPLVPSPRRQDTYRVSGASDEDDGTRRVFRAVRRAVFVGRLDDAAFLAGRMRVRLGAWV